MSRSTSFQFILNCVYCGAAFINSSVSLSRHHWMLEKTSCEKCLNLLSSLNRCSPQITAFQLKSPESRKAFGDDDLPKYSVHIEKLLSKAGKNYSV